MAWTPPTTVATGAPLTSTAYNAQVVTNLQILGGALTSYTPTLTNITLGTGSTVVAKAALVGKLLLCKGRITFGTSGALTGAPRVSLPATIQDYIVNTSLAVGTCWDNSASASFHRFVVAATSTSITWQDASGTALSATVPFTWAVNDWLSWNFECEVA